jgi:diguanylate cyclase (GGDEF)-like protein
MKTDRIPTIRTRLLLLVMACLIPASLMVVALISYNYQQDRARRVKEAMATARAIASAVDRDLGGMQAALLALATSPHLASDDLAAFYKQAKDVLKTQAADNIVLVDRTFQQRLNTFRPFGSELPAERNNPWLQQVFNTAKPVTSDIFLGPVTRKPLITVSIPVYRGDTVVNVLGGAILPERLSALLTQQRLAADRIGAIFDSTGVIVARTHQGEGFVGTKGPPDLIARMAQVPEGSLETKTVDGIPILSVFSRSAVSNWTVAIGIPSYSLIGELGHSLWWLVAGTVLLLLTSLALAWSIGGKIARAVHELTAPALALGSGEAVTVPSLHVKEADEVGRALTRASGMLMAAQHRANHDALSGLANRHLFDEILRRHLASCQETDTRLAIVCIDLDGFKPINDMHGHATGDEILRTVATRLKNSIRQSDLAARIGGDEFALILMHTGLEAAETVATKVLDSLSIPYSIGAQTLEISASIGIAAYPESGTTAEVLSRRADEAMYKAKVAGKRCYAVAG